MITKSDWRMVGQHLMSDERRRLGDPPTAEEMLAYTRGELAAEEEQRVRERLVAHPDLVRTLTEPFPTEGAKEGDPDFLSDAEFARHWASMQNRLRKRRSGVSPWWRITAAMAAMLIAVLGTLLWQAYGKLAQPRIIWDEQVLLPDGRRGPASATTVAADGDSVLLVIPLIGQRDFHQYRLAIVDASERTRWSGTAPHPGESNSFVIVVPRRFLRPGTYRIVVYGRAGAIEELLATYPMTVPR